MVKAFKFRLDPLLRYRKHQEDMKRRDHAEVKRSLMAQNQILLQCLQEEAKGKEDLTQIKKQQQYSILDLRYQEQYLYGVARKIRNEYDVLQKKLLEESQKRKVLTEARKKVRVLELLRDRQHQAYHKDVARAEQKEMDEIGVNRFRRNPGVQA